MPMRGNSRRGDDHANGGPFAGLGLPECFQRRNRHLLWPVMRLDRLLIELLPTTGATGLKRDLPGTQR